MCHLLSPGRLHMTATCKHAELVLKLEMTAMTVKGADQHMHTSTQDDSCREQQDCLHTAPSVGP